MSPGEVAAAVRWRLAAEIETDLGSLAGAGAHAAGQGRLASPSARAARHSAREIGRAHV